MFDFRIAPSKFNVEEWFLSISPLMWKHNGPMFSVTHVTPWIQTPPSLGKKCRNRVGQFIPQPDTAYPEFTGVNSHDSCGWFHPTAWRVCTGKFWLVVWNICIIFVIFPYIGNNHPNSLIFSRGVGQPPTRKIIKCNKLPSNHFDMFELVFKLLFRRQNQHPLRMNRWYQASKYGWFIVALLTLLVFFAKRPDPTPFVFPQKKWPS